MDKYFTVITIITIKLKDVIEKGGDWYLTLYNA